MEIVLGIFTFQRDVKNWRNKNQAADLAAKIVALLILEKVHNLVGKTERTWANDAQNNSLCGSIQIGSIQSCRFKSCRFKSYRVRPGIPGANQEIVDHTFWF